MILYMYIALGQGQTVPRGQSFDVNRNVLSLWSFATSSKKSLWSLILYIFIMILYMYIVPGQELTTPWGRNLDVNRNILSLLSFVANFKKNLFEVWFYTIFSMIWYMYIALGQGQTAPRWQNFDVNRKAFSLYPFVTSFKEISLKLVTNG